MSGEEGRRYFKTGTAKEDITLPQQFASSETETILQEHVIKKLLPGQAHAVVRGM